MDRPATTVASGTQTRQKRILPSRSRRGGPGVGSCDVDLQILDTYKRQAENEPLIPANSQFLLTTDSSQLPSAGSSSAGALALNLRARGRYFDRPEVIKSYKEQSIIQTPEYTSLSDDAIVGGRFRPRGAEDAAVDTSDAAYEKRHRKYEAFEKRLRLREKEKLKHEQYKLKERIEQLRAMDGAAFLHLPAASFPLPPDALEPEEGDSSHVNGSATYLEGERRRKEMLDVALQLEERYRVLLPPDRPWTRKSIPIPAPEPGVHDGESEVEEVEKKVEKLKLKIKLTPRTNLSVPQSSISVSTPPKPPPPSKSKKSPSGDIGDWTQKPDPSISAPRMIKPPSLAQSTLDPAVVNDSPLLGRKPNHHHEALTSRPHKRVKSTHASAESSHARARRASLPPIATIPVSAVISSTHETPSKVSTSKKQSDRPTSVLIIAALRTSSMPRSRKNQRNHSAFGAKVPPVVDEEREFELPSWLLQTQPGSEDSDRDFPSGHITHAQDGPRIVQADVVVDSDVK